MASGIGFAIEENLLYLIERHTTILSSLVLMIVRSLSTCLMHGVLAGAIGFAFTIARRIWISKRTRFYSLAAVAFVLFGYIAAIGIHSAFNFVITSRWQPLAILIPGVVFVVGSALMKRIESSAPETKRTAWR